MSKEERKREVARKINIMVIGIIIILVLLIIVTTQAGGSVDDKSNDTQLIDSVFNRDSLNNDNILIDRVSNRDSLNDDINNDTPMMDRKASHDSLKVEDENKYMIDIEGISQDNIPTGCESVSAVMVLNYLGIEISPEIFIDEFLPKEDFYYKNGCIYGANPEEKFAGNPYDNYSLGCFPPVISGAICNMIDSGYEGSEYIKVKNLDNQSLEGICSTYIANNLPILVWVTVDMTETKNGTCYRLNDNTEYTWKSGEHCMVLCGYDEDKYFLKDPLSDGKTVSYKKEIVSKRYEEMGSRALAIYK